MMDDLRREARVESVDVAAAVRDVVASQPFAMLASEGEGGRPHASFMAVACSADLRSLVLATHRAARKYGNMKRNPRVALLLDGRDTPAGMLGAAPVVTANGTARELEGSERSVAARLLVARHPALASLVAAPTCALLRVEVEAWELVRGVDDVRRWIPAGEER